jgi:hypothetical protein
MDGQKATTVNARQGGLLVIIQDGHLMIRMRLPVRWVLLLICLWATIADYPSIVELIMRLMNT